jgi:hypothetical protein
VLGCVAICLLAVPAAASERAPVPRFGDLRHVGIGRFSTAGTTETSTNWAGYAVMHKRPFTSVTGRWVQPTASCSTTERTFSAFWIGLGGFSERSFAVEQTGTVANCSDGTPYYRAWYELYPAPPVYLRILIRPGDLLNATVAVEKTKTIVIRLKNVTTGKAFTRKLRMAHPDRSSAEWVAEAPTGCDYTGVCSTLPLTNFGTVSFSHGTATVKGHRGRISDPSWAATAIELHDDPADPSQAGANAIPGALGPDGGSFAITWQQLTPPPPSG